MSTTAQGTSIRCDAPNCALPATIEEGAWGFCATHAGKNKTPAPAAVEDRSHLSRAHTPAATSNGSAPTTAASAPMVQIMGGGTIGLLLEQASGHSNRRVTTLAAKIETHIEQLRQLVTSLADDEKRKTAEQAAKTAAKAKVARLQAELAAARAALRGKPVSAIPDRPAAAARHVVDQQLACRKGCGRVSPNPQGRGAHERHCNHASTVA